MAETTNLTTPIGALPAQTGARTILTSDDPDVIRGEIARTRAEMSQTIDMIQERLTPAALKEQAVDIIRDGARKNVDEMTYQAKQRVESARMNMMQNVRTNPAPYALIGLGMAWLLASRNQNRSGSEWDGRSTYNGYGYGTQGQMYSGASYGAGNYGAGNYGSSYSGRSYGEPGMGERISQGMDDARQTAGEAVETVEERVRDAASAAQRKAEDLSSTVREGAQDLRYNVMATTDEARRAVEEQARMARMRAEQGGERVKMTYRQMMDENPLVVGIAALAVGTLIGLSLPSTSMENQFLGPKRDELVEEARVTAQDVMQRAQRVAEEAKTAAVDAAKDEARRQDLPTPDSAQM